MTVCIAGMCEGGRALVSCSDEKISLGFSSSADAVTRKSLEVYPLWTALYAGNDLSRVYPISRRVTAHLLGNYDPNEGLPGVSVTTVMDAFAQAYVADKKYRAETEVLGVYGISVDTFWQKGRQKFGAAAFEDLRDKIEAIQAGCTFLVSGFDLGYVPHVFTIDPSGSIKDHDPPGFWAIGSGNYNALTTLFFHGFSVHMPLDRALYHVCEAKFMAESATGVGKATDVGIMEFRQKGEFERTVFRTEDLSAIRMAWEQEGRPSIPKAALEETRRLLQER